MAIKPEFDNILDYLVDVLQVDYVSSLRELSMSHALYKNIEKINSDDYPVERWRDACKYLAGEKLSADNSAQAKQELLSYIKRKK